MILKLVAFSMCVTLVLVVLKENFKGAAVVVTIVACGSVLVFCSNMLFSVIDSMKHIWNGVSVNKESLNVVVKALAVSYITSFGTDICLDAGERAIASALEIAGKIIMLSMAFPMLAGIFKSVSDIIG